MFLNGRLERLMSKVSSYDSWGGGGYSDSGSGRVAGNYGDAGTGTGGDYWNQKYSEGMVSDFEKKMETEALQMGLGFAASILSGMGALGLGKAAFDAYNLNSKVQKGLIESGAMTESEAKAVSDEVVRRAVAARDSGAFDNIRNENDPKEVLNVLSTQNQGSGDTLLNTKLKSNFGDSGTSLAGQTNYKYDMNSPQVWEDYVNSNYDKALNEYRNQASKINTATDKQTGVLDTLISGLQSGNNLNPITRQVGDQTYSFIPKANRETATQISDLLGKRTTGEFASALGGNANLNYLDRLKELADMEQKKIAVDKGIDINQQQVEQNEPGLLDYAKGIGSLFSGVSGLFK